MRVGVPFGMVLLFVVGWQSVDVVGCVVGLAGGLVVAGVVWASVLVSLSPGTPPVEQVVAVLLLLPASLAWGAVEVEE